VVYIQQRHWEQMRAHVTREAPLEACGLVAGKKAQSAYIYEMENEANSPVRYRIPPKAQLEAFMDMEVNGWDFLAIYHSHPLGPEMPSSIDLAEAAYPETVQLIWSSKAGEWQCQGFRIDSLSSQAIRLETTQ
jgi:proteasome lid subunit RPN8/RPN11